MSILVKTNLDFENRRGIINLAPATAAGEAVVFEQLNAAVEGISWKESCRVSTQANQNLATPGTSIDGITLTNGDRVLVRSQTSQPENGIYIFNGSATSMTRALDASTFDELEAAVVTVEEGTDASNTFRQTQVNGVINTNNIIWTTFGSSAPAATETTAGIAEIATQAEVDAGTDDTRIVTPMKLTNFSGLLRKFSQTIGNGSSTLITVNHNLGTNDVQVEVFETSGSERSVFVETRRSSINQVTLSFETAPSTNSLRVVVIG